MPKVEGAPKELNTLLETVYAKALKEYKGDKAKASASAWATAKGAGWKKVKGKWVKKKKEMSAEHSVSAQEHQIFEAGTHETKAGETITYTEQDLDELCETFNAEEPPHYIPGHSSDWPGVTMIPSLGRITGGLKRIGKKLYAVGAEFTDRLAGWVKEGFYDQRSCEIGKVNGKLKLYAVAMLGAQPPSVKGMPPINAEMLQSDYMFSRPEGVVEFAESVTGGLTIDDQLTVVGDLGSESTKTNLDEICATFLTSIQGMIDDGEDRDQMCNEVYELSNDILHELNIHDAFQERLEQLLEEHCGEHSEHRSFWDEFTSRIKSLLSTKPKEGTDMDAQEKTAYEKTIADQKKQIDEFAAKSAADKAASDKALIEVTDKQLRADIKSFCAANKLDTNKHKDMKLEEILFAAAKANQTIEFSETKDGKEVKSQKPLLEVLQTTLKGFQIASPQEGELAEFNEPLKGEKPVGTSLKMRMAENYVDAHPAEFSELPQRVQKVAAALQRESNQQIKFTNPKE
jgi:hypothetical protein